MEAITHTLSDFDCQIKALREQAQRLGVSLPTGIGRLQACAEKIKRSSNTRERDRLKNYLSARIQNAQVVIEHKRDRLELLARYQNHTAEGLIKEASRLGITLESECGIGRTLRSFFWNLQLLQLPVVSFKRSHSRRRGRLLVHHRGCTPLEKRQTPSERRKTQKIFDVLREELVLQIADKHESNRLLAEAKELERVLRNLIEMQSREIAQAQAELDREFDHFQAKILATSEHVLKNLEHQLSQLRKSY